MLANSARGRVIGHDADGSIADARRHSHVPDAQTCETTGPKSEPTDHNRATTKAHLAATDELSLFGGVEVRTWKGVTDAGETVIALIAAIAAPGSIMSMLPAPPPDHDWIPPTTAAMGELWSLASKLADGEANALVAIAKGWINDRQRKSHHP
jgi:hypothetical protein